MVLCLTSLGLNISRKVFQEDDFISINDIYVYTHVHDIISMNEIEVPVVNAWSVDLRLNQEYILD